MKKTSDERLVSLIDLINKLSDVLELYHIRITNLENGFIQAEKRYNSDKANKDVQ